VLLEHPNVAEAVVFAMPESRLGEEVAAAIVLRHPRPTAANDIRKFAASRLSYSKIPRQLVFLGEIPKGPTGKLQRIGLAARLGMPREEQQENVPSYETRTPLEDVFATMWAQIVGRERIGPDDNFFEVGGDSLAAMELIAAIEQVTGQRITIATLFQAQTIRQLAAIVSRHDSGGQSYVVPLQGKGLKQPFFCVEAGPRYLGLAHLLGPDRPFLGLIYPAAIATSIEAIAEFSVKSIRAVQPDGPYFVGGWCSGGLIAYEIAQQLLRLGQDVALLVMFDAVNPGRLDDLSISHAVFVRADEFFRKIWFHLRSMTRLEFGDLPDYFLERVRNFWHTLTRRTWAAQIGTKVIRPVLRSKLPNIYFVAKRYRPKPYPGRVLLFRRGLRPISRYLDWRLGWGGVIKGPVDVVEVEGGHSDMFDEPGVRRTAAALAEGLRGHAQDEDQQRARNG
jgi:thioesterase domain-containing protein/acyl carrier protein